MKVIYLKLYYWYFDSIICIFIWKRNVFMFFVCQNTTLILFIHFLYSYTSILEVFPYFRSLISTVFFEALCIELAELNAAFATFLRLGIEPTTVTYAHAPRLPEIFTKCLYHIFQLLILLVL